MTEEELIHGLSAGFLDELDTIAVDLGKAREANDAVKAGVAGAKPIGYSPLLRRVEEAGQTIAYYERIIGVDAARPLRERVTSLRETVSPLCDDGTQRAAMLDLDLDDDE